MFECDVTYWSVLKIPFFCLFVVGLVWFEHILLNLFQRDWAQVLKLILPSPYTYFDKFNISYSIH